MARITDPAELFEAARNGDRGALARLLSYVERGGEQGRQVGRLAYPHSGEAYTVGLTGAPGAGKKHPHQRHDRPPAQSRSRGRRARDRSVVAVHRWRDPGRPGPHARPCHRPGRLHPVDWRRAGTSVGSRSPRPRPSGCSTPSGAAGCSSRPVGVGQVEVEVAGKADTTVVVVNPGWGDSVQANKAGLMEIADVFVINKADRDGVEETRRDLEQMLELSDLPPDAWRPPIVPTIASAGEGVAALWDAVSAHRAHAEQSGVLAERRSFRSREELREIVTNRLRERALCNLYRRPVGPAHRRGRRPGDRSVDRRRRDARRRRRLTAARSRHRHLWRAMMAP